MTTPRDKADVWMPLYIGDYLADTTRLTTEQHGAYLLLIMDYWRSGPPPDNDAVLAQITRLNADAWSNARAMLEHYFSIANGCWKHARIDDELAKAKANKERITGRAAKAAAARWAKEPKSCSSNATSNAQAVPKECPSPSPSPIEDILPPVVPHGGRDDSGASPDDLPEKPKKKQKQQEEHPAFAELWAIYPQRPGKSRQNALRAFLARVGDGDTPEVIIAGVRAYAAYCRHAIDDPRHIKLPETFLGRGKHYESDWSFTVGERHGTSEIDNSAPARVRRAIEQQRREREQGGIIEGDFERIPF